MRSNACLYEEYKQWLKGSSSQDEDEEEEEEKEEEEKEEEEEGEGEEEEEEEEEEDEAEDEEEEEAKKQKKNRKKNARISRLSPAVVERRSSISRARRQSREQQVKFPPLPETWRFLQEQKGVKYCSKIGYEVEWPGGERMDHGYVSASTKELYVFACDVFAFSAFSAL